MLFLSAGREIMYQEGDTLGDEFEFVTDEDGDVEQVNSR